MRIKTNIIWALIIISLFSGCTDNMNGYKATVIERENISNQNINEWIEKSTDDSGYHEYINSDPDSWEMFIYYPNVKVDAGNYVYYRCEKLEIVGSKIKIFVEWKYAANDSAVVNDLLLHITAPTRETWPNESELYVDGQLIQCISNDFSK